MLVSETHRINIYIHINKSYVAVDTRMSAACYLELGTPMTLATSKLQVIIIRIASRFNVSAETL